MGVEAGKQGGNIKDTEAETFTGVFIISLSHISWCGFELIQEPETLSTLRLCGSIRNLSSTLDCYFYSISNSVEPSVAVFFFPSSFFFFYKSAWELKKESLPLPLNKDSSHVPSPLQGLALTEMLVCAAPSFTRSLCFRGGGSWGDGGLSPAFPDRCSKI